MTQLRALSRRSFLRLSAAAAVTAACGWRFLGPVSFSSPLSLKHLSRREAATLVAAYQTITGESDPKAMQDALSFFDAFVGRLEGATRLELKAALALVEQSPLFFHGFLGCFSELDGARRVRCLEGWRSGSSWRHPVFGALKELSYLHYYTRPAHWARIGYDGPLVEKGAVIETLESRYRGLEAGT